MERKIDGLRFLQRDFFANCVDCYFVGNNGSINERILSRHRASLFRVRSGTSAGSELMAPQKTCRSVSEVRAFIGQVREQSGHYEFVVHRVEPWYFNPLYIGTISLFHSWVIPEMHIDFQRVSPDLVRNINKVRPRDWPIAAGFIYRYGGPLSQSYVNDPAFRIETVKTALYQLWKIGRRIQEIKDTEGKAYHTMTRFNVYANDRIVLDDHRAIGSFQM